MGCEKTQTVILLCESLYQSLRRISVLDFALTFAKLRSLSRTHILVLMWALTTIRVANYRCSRKRWFFHGSPGSRRTPLRLHKSRKVDIATRYCAPLPTAAVIRLSRIASALSRICNIPTQTIIFFMSSLSWRVRMI